MKKIYLIGGILVAFSLYSTYSIILRIQENRKVEVVKQKANNAVELLAKTLKKNLKTHIEASGLEGAAGFCAYKANEIEQGVNSKLAPNISIKRVSLKNRNPNNYPSGYDLIKLIQFKEKEQYNIPIKDISLYERESYWIAYKPIYVKKVCLKCHGDDKNLNKQAYKIIEQKYPQDKAVDYKLGDLRGAFVIKINK